MRAAILLAAGSSRRFHGGNKLLVRVGGRPLIARALDTALAAPVGRVIVVTGYQAPRVARAIGRRRRVAMVHARDHRSGLAASLRAGLGALRPRERELFVFLGDMPAIPRWLARRVALALRPGVDAVRPRAGGVPGHPVLVRRPSRGDLARLSGDRGLGALLAGRAVRWIEMPPRALCDVDTRRDLRRAR